MLEAKKHGSMAFVLVAGTALLQPVLAEETEEALAMQLANALSRVRPDRFVLASVLFLNG